MAAQRALEAPAAGSVNLLKSGSASVAYATSACAAHPPADALDETRKTYWITTGMFPQEIVFKLSRRTSVSTVKLLSLNAQDVSIEFSTRDSPRDFKEVAGVKLPDDGLHMENFTIRGGAEAKYIKIRITSGHGEFAAVYNVSAF